MKRPGTPPTVVAALALALGVLAAPDLALLARHAALRASAAGLAALLVLALADRRAPRRLVAVGVAVAALGLGWDVLRAERGVLRLFPRIPASAFEETGAGGRTGLRPLPAPVTLEAVAPDGSVALAEGGRRVDVSRTRAADLSGHRVGHPRRTSGAPAVAVPGEPVELTVAREPAALAAGLGVLVALLGVAWSRW